MCVFFGSYYRDVGTRLFYGEEWCETPGSGALYQGTTSCVDSLSCVDGVDWEQPDAGVVRELCFMHTCEPASFPLRGLLKCRSFYCGNQCWSEQGRQYDSPECQMCVAQSCTTEQTACTSATCAAN